MIRPFLKYESTIWSPYTKSNINYIKRIQNCFLKFIAFKFKIIIDQHDYTNKIPFLNLLTLASRPELADIY